MTTCSMDVRRLALHRLHCSIGAALQPRRSRVRLDLIARKVGALAQPENTLKDRGMQGMGATIKPTPENVSSSRPPPPGPDQDDAATARLAEEMLADRLASNRKASSSNAMPASGGSTPGKESEQATELIFKLERRGDGWGEEIIPHITVEQRPIEPSTKSRQAAVDTADPDGWQPDSLEAFLKEIGVPPSDVDRLVNTAVAWRVTPGGRPLIDRRRQSRLARNVRIVAEHLEVECGVPFGPRGVAAVFQQVPELMLCKPTSNDRWDRRAVELAAYRWRHGDCNIPETWADNLELGVWVKRQRVARAAGQLSSERLQVLERMGFEFGDLAQVTDEWEHRFDQLIDWLLWHAENGQRFSWVGVDWGERGGATARELALWLALQREFRRRQLLPAEATQRFEAIQVEWDPADGGLVERQWMTWLGRLVYVAEKRCASMRRPPPRLKQQQQGRRGGASGGGSEERGAGMEEADGKQFARRGPKSASELQARARLASSAAMRRAALASTSHKEAPGLDYWVARQRWLWRQGRLPAERVLLLHLAGADMDVYTPTEWQSIAHTAAAVAQGSQVTLGVTLPPRSEQPAAAAPSKRGRKKGSTVNGAGVPRAQLPLAALPSPAAVRAAAAQGAGIHATPGTLSLRARRWVQAQQAMFAAGRLSRAQLRYLAFLGITWLLSDAVVKEGEVAWRSRFEGLRQGPAASEDEELQAWLSHQRGLLALGLLPKHRKEALEGAGVTWRFCRAADADEWDSRLSQLLAHNAEHGSLPAVDAGPQCLPGLAEWLGEQQAALAAGRLPRARAAQLAALGAVAVEGKTGS